ncbi:Ig-like domain-containing protein [Hyalangium sp.]|uniref:Ig-like domain-containing protein n=1 Tax=Hyalangium sp. TaxID=2028555 RepID=UPI002D2949A7|nr:Ig-like domain-containing protein [Hyalangium sp.]HYI00583.1 Ig-like domain-containing protein [Hyalangium sp.]
MSVARRDHTATLLPDGRVLVVGGIVGLPEAGAEVYDPVTNSWSATGAMSVARHFHTATLLPSGLALVTGGWKGFLEPVVSAEIFDPATGSWSTTGGMATGRALHTETLLPGGGVLVVGGLDRIATSQVYPGVEIPGVWRPVIHTLAVRKPGAALRITGSGLRGRSEAHGGNSQGSATGLPLVSLRTLEGERPLRLTGRDFSDAEVTVTLPTLEEGYYLLTVVVNGLASGQVLRVDATAPGAPEVTAPASGALLNNSRPTFSGTAEPGGTVRVLLGGVAQTQVAVDAAGAWSFTPGAALAQGPHEVAAVALDSAENEGPASLSRAFTVDSLTPEAPRVTAPVEGASLFDTRRPDIAGTAEPGSTVRLLLDDAEIATLEVDEQGSWRFGPAQELALGNHTVLATATDRAGNTSEPALVGFTVASRKSYYTPSCASASPHPALWALLLLIFCLRRSTA